MSKIIILIEVIVKQIREVIQLLTSKEDITLDEIETKVWSVVLEIGRLMMEGVIRIRGTGFTTPSGEVAEYRGDRDMDIDG